MKMYAAFDTDRQKYFRLVYDGRDSFTVKPAQLSNDKERVEAIAKDYSKASTWKRYGLKGATPKLVTKTFLVEELEHEHA